MRIYSIAIGIVASAAVMGSQGRTTWPIKEAPAELRSVVARADLAITAMHDSLLRELADEMKSGGPATAINSCHIDTVLITQRFAREGLAAGRTSDRLRNPTNRPPAWAKQIVVDNAGRRSHDVDGYVVDLGEKLGVLRPISQRPICANCHGPVERVSRAVRAVLAERYPADKAIGFREGEIRGWFWVEMPKRPK